MRYKFILPLLVFLLPLTILKVTAQNASSGLRVLVVVAHPDDESIFSVTLYKIAKEQHGTVDLFVITDGEAGYKYSTLAEEYYHVDLTDKKAGIANLPRIRKKELRNAGNIIGVSNYYFEDQTDAHFGLDEKEPLDTSWNIPQFVRHRYGKWLYIFHKASRLFLYRSNFPLRYWHALLIPGCGYWSGVNNPDG